VVVWAVEFPGLRLLTLAFAMEDSMNAKRIVTRAILAAAAAGSIATGIAVPLVAVTAPTAGTVVAVAHPDFMPLGG
jgi:hypothetical protein